MNNNIVITEPLPALASEINAAALSAGSAAKDAVQHALRAGRLLIEAKDQLPHGQWEPWLAEHCQVSPRMARAYMRLAKMLPSLENGNDVAVLSLRQALQTIALPPPAPASERVRPPRDETGRAAKLIASTATSLKRLQRELEGNCNGVSRTQLAATRNWLVKSLAAIDELSTAHVPAHQDGPA